MSRGRSLRSGCLNLGWSGCLQVIYRRDYNLLRIPFSRNSACCEFHSKQRMLRGFWLEASPISRT